MTSNQRLFAAGVCALLLSRAGGAQRFEFFPGGTYDATIPTPESVLGYPIGAYHTDYARLERWLDALEVSDRVRVVRYGESIERRPLYLVVVSSPANLARLDAVKAGLQKLADPRTTTDGEADGLATSLPAVAWMNHANDGNESAAFESAIQTMYQLAAGTDDTTRLILDRLVTIVNPAHNPESHERFVAWYNSVQVGSSGVADPAAAEHHAPWGLNTNNNHYQIDLNRDAFFITQPETAAIVKAFNEWNPSVFVDHHGQTKNMFFPPPAEAINLNVTANQVEWMDRYGEAIASALDRQGASYYRRGRFDLFYAGFWDSWPTLNGSVGMTFETDGGGSKGLAFEREDKTILTLRDGVLHHHTGTMATLRLTAEQKDRRLRDFYQYKKSAIDEGQREPLRQVVLVPGADARRAELLVDTLQAQRIEVHRTTAPLKLAKAASYMGGSTGAREIPAGAFVISMAQPQKRLARALLELEPAFKKEFLENEERKKRRADLLGERPRDGFYDTTAWSLPILYGVEAYWAEDAVNPALMTRVEDPSPAAGRVEDPATDPGVAPGFRRALPATATQPGGTGNRGDGQPSVAIPAATYGYLFSGDTYGAMRVTATLLRERFNVAVATEPFRAAGHDFGRGAVVARIERNPPALSERLGRLAADNGVQLYPLNSARVERGADLGEDPIVELEHPSIALVTDEPTDDRSYGAAWYTLERRLGVTFTALKIAQLRNADLSRYNVIVVPHGAPAAYQELLGETGVQRLRRWTQDGGTLVLIKGAAAFATRKGVEWTSATLKRDEVGVRLFFEEPGAEGGGQKAEGSLEPARGAKPPSASERGWGPASTDKSGQKPAGGEQTSPDAEKPLTREMDLIRTPGALLRVKIDPEHYLGYGYRGDIGATIQSNYAFTISREGKNVAAFPGEESLKLAGFVWPEARKALARTLYTWVERAGRGQVILFADDPNFRATQLSTLRLFFNAIFLAPSFANR